MRKVDVMIPAYKPGKEFEQLLERLMHQNYPIQKIIVMNTQRNFWKEIWEETYPLLEVHHLSKEEFDHGGTRKAAAALSTADIMMFMTQDAMPKDEFLVKNMMAAFEKNEKIAAVYARQLPTQDCNELERYTRSFNYPETSSVKSKADLPQYGIKTFFCSNVCAAYKKEIYEKLGGFVEKTIFNEDMIYAGKLIEEGYEIAYAAEAEVIHSHNYSSMQQLHRNFDLGVSQAQYPEVFDGISSEGEGMKLVKKSMIHLCKTGRFYLLPKLLLQSGCKYIGFFMGKRYKKLPKSLILWFTMNKSYWKKGNTDF